MDTIKADELRKILFFLDNQDMTVREVREMLFNLTEGTDLRVGFEMFKQAEAQHTARKARSARLAEL